MSGLLNVLDIGPPTGVVLLPFFSLLDARNLRLVSHRFYGIVTQFQWYNSVFRDLVTDIPSWRVAFPKALACFVSAALTNDLFCHFRQLSWLHLIECDVSRIGDEAFSSLINVKHLNLARCKWKHITEHAFSQLTSVEHLDLNHCGEVPLSAMALGRMVNLHTLILSYSEVSLPDHAFALVPRLRDLQLKFCGDRVFRDASFQHPHCLTTLDLQYCNHITDLCLSGLAGLTHLCISFLILSLSKNEFLFLL
jgi:hypothetical protein